MLVEILLLMRMCAATAKLIGVTRRLEPWNEIMKLVPRNGTHYCESEVMGLLNNGSKWNVLIFSLSSYYHFLLLPGLIEYIYWKSSDTLCHLVGRQHYHIEPSAFIRYIWYPFFGHSMPFVYPNCYPVLWKPRIRSSLVHTYMVQPCSNFTKNEAF